MCRDIGGSEGCTNGANGLNGQNGLNGLDATISIGSITNLPFGSSATVVNSGTGSAAILNFGIPQGEPGSDGTNGFTNVRINHTQSTWLAGVATTMTITNSGYGLTGGFNGPGVPALYDSFKTIDFQILPGTYTLYVVTARNQNRGLISWYLDNSITPLGTMDTYVNGVDTIIQSIPNVVITASLNNSHFLKAIVTKNASSTGYYVYLSEIWLK
jgi:hypothetical protein